MKKLIAVIASLAVLALCACSADVEESTTLIDETEAVSETTATEETTRRNPTIHEMSPVSMNTEPYVDVEKNTAKIKFSSFKEISSEDSYLKIKELDKILASALSDTFVNITAAASTPNVISFIFLFDIFASKSF